MELAKSVEEFYAKQTNWVDELQIIRHAVLSTGLKEELKWGAPAYTYKGKNLIGLASFKNYVGLWFHQGVFLSDPSKVLVNAQEGVTKALRQWRFNDVSEIDEDLIKTYVLEAIDNHIAGKEIKPTRNKEYAMPDELKAVLDKNSVFNSAFYELTWGKQKEYANYISEAKQAKTKESRIQKIIPMVLNNVGLNDKYK